MDTTDILKSKSLEEIYETLESEEDFKNKRFLKMVKQIYPEKFEMVIRTLPLCNTIDIYDLIKELMDGKYINCNSVTSMCAIIKMLELCGINSSNILLYNIRTIKTQNQAGKEIEKVTYPFTIKTSGKQP